MEITKAAEYALRAVTRVADAGGKVCSAPKLARETGIPGRFLAKILRRLVQRGVLRSTPGARGGFVLSRAPGAVSVWDVVDAIEERTRLVPCVGPGGTCAELAQCGLHPVWERAQAAMETELRRTTLDEVVRLTHALRSWPKTGREAAGSAPPRDGAAGRAPRLPGPAAGAR